MESSSSNEGEVRPQRTSSLSSYLGRRNSVKLTKRLTLSSLKGKTGSSKEQSLAKNQLVKIGVLSKSIEKTKKTSKHFHYKFGAPLEESLEVSEIPLFVLKATSLLEATALSTEGLFFFDVESQPHVASVLSVLESGESDVNDITDPHTLAGLLKLFFIKLPTPLIPEQFYNHFVQCTDITNNDNFLINELRSLVYKLPKSHRVLLQFLLSFLQHVTLNSTQNLMPVTKLSKTWGKILLRTEQPTPEELSTKCPLVIEKLITHYDKIFLIVEDKEIQYLMKEGVPIVKSGIVDAIVLKLLEVNTSEPEYRDIILYTNSYFITTLDLLALILSTYSSLCNSIPLWKDKLTARVYKLLKKWLKYYYHDILLNKHSVVSTLEKYLDFNPKKFTRLIQKTHSLNDAVSSLHNNTENSINSISTPSIAPSILDFSPLEIAKQMTIYEHSLFLNININECTHKKFLNKDASSTFAAMTNKFNQWGQWVATDILKRTDAQDRADVIAHFIKIADSCKDLKNYNSCYALLGGLNLSSVSNTRLKLTWQKVNKAALSKYTKLMEFFAVTKNYKIYREDLFKQSTPLIPYFALYPKYLFNIEENTNTFEEENPTLINVSKLRSIYQIMKEIKSFQTGTYDFVKVDQIWDFIKNIDVLDEQSLFTLSLKYEPKDKNKEVVSINPLFNNKSANKRDSMDTRPRGGSLDSNSSSSLDIIPISPSNSGSNSNNSSRQRQDSIDSTNEDFSEDEKLTEANFVDLESCLANDKSIKLFGDYLSSISKHILLDFIIDIEQYKLLEDPLLVQERAVSIFTNYFGASEDKRISVDDNLLHPIKENLSHKIFSHELFNFVQADVYASLESLFNDFKKSSLLINALAN